MFSLIITLLSIALVAALALATLYYGGTSWGTGGDASRAAQILTQGQQVLGAADTFRVEHGRWPNSMEELVTMKYLKEVPAIEVQVAGAGKFVNEAQAAGTKEVWTMPSAGRPTFVLSNAVGVPVCRAVNEKSRGDDGILKNPHTTLTSQCFGSADTALTVVVTKDPGDLGAALAPIVVRAAGVPSDTTSPDWHRIPVKAMSAETPSENPTQPAEGAPVVLVNGVLPNAIVGVPYSVNLNNFLTVDGQAHAGSGVTWSALSAGLPDGLFLTADGFISGTPTFEGPGDISVRATYGASSGEQTYQVAAVPLTVSLSTLTLPTATVGLPFSYDFKALVASNDSSFVGTSASFSATGLPTWLSMSNSGVLSGTPASANEAGTSVQVTASYLGKNGQQVYTIVVNGVAFQVTQVELAEFHACAVTQAGGMKCWGTNTKGELGTGVSTGNILVSAATPQDVPGLTGSVKDVAVGDHFSCAVTTAGEVYCTGSNYYGQLGDGTKTDRTSPVKVPGLTGVVSLEAGRFHVCALMPDSSVKCWGQNSYGQVGTGVISATELAPVTVASLPSAAEIDLGSHHSCARTNAGAVYCWGNNSEGQKGAATATPGVPKQVTGIASGATAITTGWLHTCAVVSGALQCWGADNGGQLGHKTTSTAVTTPQQVSGLTSGVIAVAGGQMHTCALMSSGSLKCWGAGGAGQLGIGTQPSRESYPVDVATPGLSFTSVYAGAFTTCGKTNTGSLKCWGDNNRGVTGTGGGTMVLVPTSVSP